MIYINSLPYANILFPYKYHDFISTLVVRIDIVSITQYAKDFDRADGCLRNSLNSLITRKAYIF